jgi:hypothetical protein
MVHHGSVSHDWHIEAFDVVTDKGGFQLGDARVEMREHLGLSHIASVIAGDMGDTPSVVVEKGLNAADANQLMEGKLGELFANVIPGDLFVMRAEFQRVTNT